MPLDNGNGIFLPNEIETEKVSENLQTPETKKVDTPSVNRSTSKEPLDKAEQVIKTGSTIIKNLSPDEKATLVKTMRAIANGGIGWIMSILGAILMVLQVCTDANWPHGMLMGVIIAGFGTIDVIIASIGSIIKQVVKHKHNAKNDK